MHWLRAIYEKAEKSKQYKTLPIVEEMMANRGNYDQIIGLFQQGFAGSSRLLWEEGLLDVC